MESRLVSTGSKWISETPLYPGDLIHNMGCYWPRPDYDDAFWKMQHMNAEKFTYGRSRAKYGYPKQAMFYYPASSGRKPVELAQRYPEKILEHSLSLTQENDGDGPYMTTQRIVDALDPSVVRPEVFAQNYRNSMIASAIAANNLRDPETGLRDTYVVGPAHREELFRSMKEFHPIMRGTVYEDAIFEAHLWGPSCLLDFTHGIYDGEHAWSRYGAVEKGVGLAIQYGSLLPIAVREGQNFDVVDLNGKPVSILDQTWEDARGLVDVVGTKVEYQGEEYRFRAETQAALLVSRFMHDEMYRSNSTELQRGQEHETVKAHYADKAEMAKFAELKEMMLPYLAEYCNWPTLHQILDRDPHLKKYWDEHVVPSAPNLKPEAEIEEAVMSYLPRGGFSGGDLSKKITSRRDPVVLKQDFPLHDIPLTPQGQHVNAFARDLDPTIFNDRNFARLGGTSNPHDEPDPDHITFEQAACMMSLPEFLHDGIPPLDLPRTLIYLDDAGAGVRPAAFHEEHGTDHPGEISALFDPLAEGGSTFAEAVAAENGADLQDRVRDLTLGKDYAAWRTENKIGNIIPLSDFQASMATYEGRREGTDTEVHESLAADGPMKNSADAVETMVRRHIDLEAHGLVLPTGEMPDRNYRYLMESVNAILGKTPRTYSGGKYQHEIFMDHDYWKPPQHRNTDQPLQKMDFLDVYIYVGMKAKAALDEPNPAKRRDLMVTAMRMTDLYERIIDPARRNVHTVRDAFSGKDSSKMDIDLNNIVDKSFVGFALHLPGLPDVVDADPEVRSQHPEYDAMFKDPEFQAFANDDLDYAEYMGDPDKRAKLGQMMWFYMRGLAIPTDKPGVNLPVSGMLLAKGIHAADRFDLQDLHPEYMKAHELRKTMQARARTNIFGQGGVNVEGPVVSKR